MEELSRQAPAEEEGNDDIEEASSDEQETQGEDAQEKGAEENPIDVDRDRESPQFRIIDSQRVFDHPASASFRYRRSSGQQFRFGKRRGPYLRRGRRKTGFRQ